jgi:hypothetical protein
MTHISKNNGNGNLVRKARRHHRYARRMNPSLALAVPGAGMVLPDGEVALPLVDGEIALYDVVATVEYRCRPARSHGPVIDMALERLADTERCVLAAQAKANVVNLPIAAE